MITARAEHCSLVVGNFLYMIGGVGIIVSQLPPQKKRVLTEGGGKLSRTMSKSTKEIVGNNSSAASVASIERLEKIAAMKNSNNEIVMAI